MNSEDFKNFFIEKIKLIEEVRKSSFLRALLRSRLSTREISEIKVNAMSFNDSELNELIDEFGRKLDELWYEF